MSLWVADTLVDLFNLKLRKIIQDRQITLMQYIKKYDSTVQMLEIPGISVRVRSLKNLNGGL